ncbi:MAG TPA: hypothetical protein PLF84_10660 [Bryobacteraceae bacterium]|nr:hypothetical protein [Bryobacterales bacterium]HRJ19498.1 hypothetical protein [Bryobacteraceae bacterium]
MEKNTFQTFVEGIRPVWGPLSSEVVDLCRRQLENLLKAPAAEEWLAALHREAPAGKELYRDPSHGFILLAHTEQTGQYRPPHDHGRGWVIYGVQQGEMGIGTYARVQEPGGSERLVRRETYLLRPGETRVYLPGDIHDTRCTKGPVLYYRFTDRDLKKEESEGHKITRYIQSNGDWTGSASCPLS